MKNINAILILALLSSSVFATTMPVKDGENIDLVLSRINFNRLSVQDDQITEIRFLQGSFTVEKNEKPGETGEPRFNESIYLRPVFDDELTLFVETRKKHHFSIRVHSDEKTGKDIELVMTSLPKIWQPARADQDEKVDEEVEADNVSPSFDEIIADMEANQVPKGFDEVKVAGQPFYLRKNIKLKLEKTFKGNGLGGYVYRVENKDSRPIEIKNEWFLDNKNLRAIRLSENVLAPGESAWLYSVYSDEPRSRS